MPALWDPRQVLGINPSESDFPCTAIVIPKKKRGQPKEPPRRCSQTFLTNECKGQACRLLDTLSRIDVVSNGVCGAMEIALVHIGRLTACPRWHQDRGRSQVDEVGAKWKDIVCQFVASERAARRRTEREQMRVLTAHEPRPPPERLNQRSRVPSVPDMEDPELRRARERAARRARENQREVPEILPQYQPRQQQEQQRPPQGPPAPQMEGHHPQQVRLNPFQQQPIQDVAPRMPQPAVLRTQAAGRRIAQQQAEARPAPNRDQFVIRDWAPRPYPVHRPEVVPEPVVENRQHDPRRYINRPVEVPRPRPAAAVPPPRPAERIVLPVDGGDVGDREYLRNRIRELHEEIARDRAEDHQLARQDPVVPFLLFQTPAREPEVVPVQRAIAARPPEQPRPRRRAAPAAAQPYVPRRRPVESCFICLDAFDGPDDAIWCQGQCGQNVHRHCYETWHLASDNVVRKCGYCRAPWVENR